MKPILGIPVVLAALLVPAACGGDDEPTADRTPAATTSDPASDPTSPSSSTATPTAPSTGTPETGDASLGCLTAGSPWSLDTRDLARQFPAAMRGVNVTSVDITGPQRLVVDGDSATFSDSTTTRVAIDMSRGLTMVMVQKHRGSATGELRAEGNRLTAASWEGEIHGTTRFTINGRATEAPFQAPASGIGERPVTFSCSGDTLRLSVQGSPFRFTFTAG